MSRLKINKMIIVVIGSFLLGFICSFLIFGINKNIKIDDEIRNDVESDNDILLGDAVESVYDESIDAKNSEDNMENIKIESSEDFVDFSKYKKGDIIKFGSYEQDNNIYNGKEPIEWIVLMSSNKKSLLLISKYVLECMPYNYDDIDTTWQRSEIRKFLNDDFLNNAFSNDEKKMVMENVMSNLKNTNYKTSSGEETLDKVFLLSESQAKRYFDKDKKSGENETRATKPTVYAKEKGVSTIVNKDLWYDGSCSFWLRTSGVDQKRAILIEKDGSLFNYGEKITANDVGVRPCIWIKY